MPDVVMPVDSGRSAKEDESNLDCSSENFKDSKRTVRYVTERRPDSFDKETHSSSASHAVDS